MNPEQLAEEIAGDLIAIFDDGALDDAFVVDTLTHVRRLVSDHELVLRNRVAAERLRDTIPAPPPDPKSSTATAGEL